MVEQIQSIILSQNILFNSSIAGLYTQTENDYHQLLDFHQNPDSHKLRRVKSVLQAQKILVADQILPGTARQLKEIRAMIRYIDRLADKRVPLSSHSTILPRNLGMNFIKANLGVPLFGYQRPEKIPREAGILLYYQNERAEGFARLNACDTEKLSVRYKDLGIELDSQGSWVYSIISPSARPPILTPTRFFPPEQLRVFPGQSYTCHMAGQKAPLKARGIEMNPYAGQYAYFFYRNSRTRKKLFQFICKKLGGMFYIPLRRAEIIAREFIEILLER